MTTEQRLQRVMADPDKCECLTLAVSVISACMAHGIPEHEAAELGKLAAKKLKEIQRASN